MDELRLEHEGVSLSALDGGGGSAVVLLHGLAGYAGEWAETASWLSERHRVLALDQRGHGASARFPPSVAPEAFVGDVVAWLDALDLERVAIVGQSFGGLIAFLTAAEHPVRISRLVVAEASPAADPGAELEVADWLESWPVPFPNRSAAVKFFGGDSLRAHTWADGLEEREDGLWPRFEPETLLRTLHAARGERWGAWGSIRCATLVVCGELGLPASEAQAMAARLQDAVVATIPGAGHDVHLEGPEEWRRVVERFLEQDPLLPPTGAGAGNPGS